VIAKFPTVCSLYAILPRCLVDRPLASSRRFANNLPLFPVDFRSVFSHRFSVFLAQISNYAVIVQYNTHRNPFLIPPAIRALPPITCCAPHNFGHFLSEPSILRLALFLPLRCPFDPRDSVPQPSHSIRKSEPTKNGDGLQRCDSIRNTLFPALQQAEGFA
jgi:hypothetical protein